MNRPGIIIIFLILLTPNLTIGQDLGMHLLAKDQVFYSRNPALPLPKKTVIGLPEGSGHLFNEGGSLMDWTTTASDGKRSVSLQRIWKSLDHKEYTSEANWAIRTFYFGKRLSKFQLGLYHTFNGDFDLQYNKELVGLLGYGNFGFLQQEPIAKTQVLDIKPQATVSVYQSIGFEGAYFINDRLSIGGGLQYLAGLYDFRSDVRRLDVDIRDPLTLKSDEDWTLHTADLVEQLSIDSIILGSGRRALGTHPGLAFNLGTSYRGDRFKIGLQVRDLGMIKWNGTTFSRQGSINYSGISIDDFLKINQSVFNQIKDTLRAITQITKFTGNYTAKLSGKVIVDAQYQIAEKWMFGGVLYYRSNTAQPYTRLMGGVQYQPSSVFLLGTQLSTDTHQTFNVGVMGALRIGVFNLYLSTDQIGAWFNPAAINRFSGIAGMSVMWGKD